MPNVVPLPFRYKTIDTPIKCDRNLIKVYPQQGSIQYKYSGTNKIIFRLPNTKSTLIDMKRSMLSFDLELGAVSGFQQADTIETLDFTSAQVFLTSLDAIQVGATFYKAVSTGDTIAYGNGGGTAPAGLVHNTNYFVIKAAGLNRIHLATTRENALAGVQIPFTAVAGSGSSHTLATTHPDYATPTLNDALSWCDRVIIRCGNQIISDVQSENLIRQINDEMTVQPEAKDGLRSILTGEGSTETKRIEIYSGADKSTGTKRRFTVPINMYVDATMIPVGFVNYAFEITFHLGNPLDCVKIDAASLNTATTADYTIDNIQWLVEEVSPLDSSYIGALSTQLGTGIDVPFTTYEHSVHTIDAGSGSKTIEIPTRNRSTKGIVWVARNQADIQKLNKDKLKVFNYNDMKEIHYRLNSQLYPQQPIDCTNGATENFLELCKYYDLVSTYNGVATRNTTNNVDNTTYTNGKFINTFGFSTHPNTNYISGKNLTSASSSLVLKINCNPTETQQIDVFIEYDAILTLGTTKVDLKR